MEFVYRYGSQFTNPRQILSDLIREAHGMCQDDRWSSKSRSSSPTSPALTLTGVSLLALVCPCARHSEYLIFVKIPVNFHVQYFPGRAACWAFDPNCEPLPVLPVIWESLVFDGNNPVALMNQTVYIVTSQLIRLNETGECELCAGIYYHRWGDAELHTLTVALFMAGDKLWYTDIPYQHYFYYRCPKVVNAL